MLILKEVSMMKGASMVKGVSNDEGNVEGSVDDEGK